MDSALPTILDLELVSSTGESIGDAGHEVGCRFRYVINLLDPENISPGERSKEYLTIVERLYTYANQLQLVVHRNVDRLFHVVYGRHPK